MKKSIKDEVSDLAKQAIIQPQEMLYALKDQVKKIRIGIPKELAFQEKRIPLCPSAVKIIINYGFEVLIENGAGIFSHYSDNDFSEAGAQIIYDRKEVFSCEIIIKVAFPTEEEVSFMPGGQLLLSAINLSHMQSEHLQMLMNKKITAIAFEYIKDSSGFYPIIHSMSEIAGKASVLIASDYLSNEHGQGILLGGITGVPPVQIVVLGAGTVGYFAVKTATALGADVRLFDNSLPRLRRLRTFSNINIYNAIIQSHLLSEVLKTTDVVIGALRPENGRTPIVVTSEMVMHMKENSILIDVSIDQGGCFETSRVTSISHPTFKKHGVIHYCVPNIPSIVPQTASQALSNILYPIIQEIGEAGSLENYLWEYPHARNGIYIYKGILTYPHLGNRFNISSKAIDLLLTSQL